MSTFGKRFKTLLVMTFIFFSIFQTSASAKPAQPIPNFRYCNVAVNGSNDNYLHQLFGSSYAFNYNYDGLRTDAISKIDVTVFKVDSFDNQVGLGAYRNLDLTNGLAVIRHTRTTGQIAWTVDPSGWYMQDSSLSNGDTIFVNLTVYEGRKAHVAQTGRCIVQSNL